MVMQQPVRAGLDIFLKDILSLFGGTSFNASGRPYGNYSGSFGADISSSNPIITNPYGVTSKVEVGPEGFDGRYKSLDLRPGQSYNFITGQLSDPNLHANTAQRLNEALQYRTVQAAGYEQASKTSARNYTSVLATLDEQYFGNASTKVETSSVKTNLDLAKEQGFNTDGTRTILGADTGKKPVAAKTPLKRALT